MGQDDTAQRRPCRLLEPYVLEQTESDSGEGSRPVVSYYSDTMLCDGRVAYMRIEALDMRSLAVDGEKIDRFLSSIADARYLVIDIQGNGGGDTRYWSEHIVPRLIDERWNFPPLVLSKRRVEQIFQAPLFLPEGSSRNVSRRWLVARRAV